MKKNVLEFFGLEEDEIELKEVLVAGSSLVLAMGIIFLPLFM
ncbi:hypothetical protein [Desemzia sp. C1]|nr:hypothetical protein [Desemzia sp. C1]